MSSFSIVASVMIGWLSAVTYAQSLKFEQHDALMAFYDSVRTSSFFTEVTTESNSLNMFSSLQSNNLSTIRCHVELRWPCGVQRR
jgi:hypothetical protein